MREEKTIYYDKNDMLALKEMSNKEVADWLDALDRGYFDKYHFPEHADDSKEYSEWEYREYAMRIALSRANRILRSNP